MSALLRDKGAIVIKAKIILSSLALLLGGTICAGAAQLDVKMNYETYTAELTYKNELAYPTYVTFVMTKGGEADKLQIGEELCMENADVTAHMQLSEGIADGTYSFTARSGGKSGEVAQASLKIVGSDTISAAVDEINRAPKEGLAALIRDKLGELLGLSGDADDAADLYIYTVRTEAGKFSNGRQIGDAWEIAAALKKIAAADGDTLPQVLEENSSILGIATDGEDYKAQTAEVCRILKVMQRAGKICSAKQMSAQFSEAIALAMVNKSALADKDTYIKKYEKELTVSSLMTEYKKLDALKVARQLDGVSCDSAADFAAKLQAAIAKLSGSSSDTGGSGSGSGGSSGGSGGGFNLSGSPSISVTPQTPAAAADFADIDSTHWAYPAVSKLSGMKIINGYEDGSFRPTKSVTREEFVTMISLAFSLTQSGDAPEFDDVVQDAWFAGYVAAASSKGIISGIGDGSFGVGRDISRQEAAVILDRILTLFGAASGSAAAEFADSEEIAAWAAEGVNRLTKCGIISGIDGSFCPADAVTRAQAAQMIFGCMQYAGTVR